MPVLLVVDKTGTIKELNIKQYVEEELYKKAGFKSDTDFKLHTTWDLKLNSKKYSISLYGKTEGRANQENKYDFPPPADNMLFFGSCLLLNKDEDDEMVDLTAEEWEKVYEKLFGGFEDIGDDDSVLSEDSVPASVPRTKEGYIKDGFVVDDPIEYDDESEEEYVPKRKAKPSKSKASKKTVQPVENMVMEKESEFLECTDELTEEAYFE
jgi:hypothetical protein